jgi:hypothetical protein
MRYQLAAVAGLICLATSCTGDHPATKSASLLTAPSKPALTMSNLPSDASTVCVATVRQRDQLIAKPAAGGAADLDALNAVIDDVCQ